MQKSEIVIVWFKRDLRVTDHKPLYEASKTLKPIFPIYVVENDYWRQPFSNRRHWHFIHDSLMELRKELKRIGQSLIRRCKGFEMNVFVYDPFVSKDIIEELGGKKVEDLTEAVKSMDAISLHMPLNEKTKNIINYDLLKTMRKNCIIINAARGGMINENDLDKALNESLIFGAGLDVFETEPPKEDNPLLKNNKVFLSPHTAAFTEECMIRMGKETIQNIIDFFEKKLDKSKIIKL